MCFRALLVFRVLRFFRALRCSRAATIMISGLIDTLGHSRPVRCCFFLLSLTPAMVVADYSRHPAAEKVIGKLVNEHGFTRQQVISTLEKAKPDQKILDSMANAAEKTRTWTAYRKSFVVDARIKQGRSFLKEQHDQLSMAQKNYGVPAHIVTAILGVETNYGGYTGKANVLNALSTLAFEHPRRSKFFTSELVEYIVLSREQGWDPQAMQGSYAGALGLSQFMPSNYRRLAVDADLDGSVDLFDVDDAIASVAHYFKHHGWKSGEPVAFPLQVAKEFDVSIIDKGIKPNSTVGEILRSGYSLDGKVLPLESSMPARVLRFNDDDGDEFWLVLENFYVISRYNPRSKYAMAVHLLSQEFLSR